MGARLGADRMAERLGCELTHHVPLEPDDVEEQRAQLEAALCGAARCDPAGADARHRPQRHPAPHPGGRHPLAVRREPAAGGGAGVLCGVRRQSAGERHRGLSVRPHAGGRRCRHPGGASQRHDDGAARRRLPRGRGGTARHPHQSLAQRRFPARPGQGRHAGAAGRRAHIDGVLAANDFMALGALEAMDEQGRKAPSSASTPRPTACAPSRPAISWPPPRSTP